MDESTSEKRAIEYAEKYGIIDYEVKGNQMIYYANYPEYLYVPKHTIKVTVDLDTGREECKVLQKWNPKGNANLRK